MRIASSLLFFALSLIFTLGSSQRIEAANVEQGRRLALLYCAGCHAIDKVSPSPLRIAPPFRNLHQRYPVETLEEALAEGIITGHPSMPQFQFEADQINDFIAFLKSLE
ncbi:mono/diheme cytochrome c family protein [Nitrobacter vulgaris]|jgi:mono/diheme cytochrome c family protein|uniref:Cytochrome C n=1 Tax=Nitrobacter vulgaris TaxID=29421 RepID=A0A1V4HVT7_NITVU|nr:cytochrome c [Nitrobacter vulgaris]MDR6305193.1 mono/diheme cytochrome c family protein [Nitrobacter vulgaris]OPH81999.1 cytochrome C [Nitrobacter vulgaris]